MKKFACLFTALLSILLICSCTKNAPDGKTDNSSDTNDTYVVGKTDGNTYESEFLGIGITLPDGWEFDSKETVDAKFDATLTELEAHGISADSFPEAYTEFIAFDKAGTTVSIISELLEPARRNKDDKSLCKGITESLSALLTGFFETISIEDITVKLGDKEFFGYDICLTDKNGKFYTREFLVRSGNYLATVTITANDPDALPRLTNAFHIINK